MFVSVVVRRFCSVTGVIQISRKYTVLGCTVKGRLLKWVFCALDIEFTKQTS